MVVVLALVLARDDDDGNDDVACDVDGDDVFNDAWG